MNSAEASVVAIHQLERLIKDLKEEVKQGFEATAIYREQLENTKARVGLLEDAQVDIINSVDSNTSEVRRLNRLQRQHNLIIYNLEAGNDASNSVLRNLVLNLFNSKLEVSVSERDLDNVIRLGQVNGACPMLVRLQSLWLKNELLRSSKKLKGSRIGISNDFSKEIRDVRKLLHPYLKLAHEANCVASLRGDKLVVFGKSYTLSDLTSAGFDPKTLFAECKAKSNIPSDVPTAGGLMASSSQSKLSQALMPAASQQATTPVQRSPGKKKKKEDSLKKRKRTPNAAVKSCNSIAKFIKRYEERAVGASPSGDGSGTM